jgi:hypothetical protein
MADSLLWQFVNVLIHMTEGIANSTCFSTYHVILYLTPTPRESPPYCPLLSNQTTPLGLAIPISPTPTVLLLTSGTTMTLSP